MSCITEEAFMKCECERCKKERETMVSAAINGFIYRLLLESINKMLKSNELQNNEKTK